MIHPVHASSLRGLLFGAAVAAAAGSVLAQTQVLVTANIATSTTWTANNVYNLQQQIYVLPGATLTIEAGTVVASTAGLGGSLAVCRGAQIFVQGTQDRPVVMTSTNDTATWVNGDPKTGTWRPACNEWGNLTVMGAAYISENAVAGNVAAPAATNQGIMEGLVAGSPGDTRINYGGGNDDDDSGSIAYLSLRYGGRVIGLNNELNGLSLGGIGRNTDIHHVEIMNNVDDGIEIWGGTVNLKYVSIWNVGDDSLDIDQGWRGKAQFGLIVQGYSANAARGSGVGDHCFEMDGAEDSDYQPVTTGVIYNFTAIGQPDARGMTAWRDNCRMQFHNCIFMDGPISANGQLVKNDNVDGDGAHGYGFNGTLTWAQTWATPFTATSTVNAPANPAAFYTAQTSGNLAEITDSIFYNLTSTAAYTEANAVGVLAAAADNVQEPASMPIASITRGPVVSPAPGGLIVTPVTFLDPRPAADALTSVAFAPRDGFFSGAHYRGGFAPGSSWLTGWTASQAFGMTPASPYTDLGQGMAGVHGDPVLAATGSFAGGSSNVFTCSNQAPNALAFFGLSFGRVDLPLFGGVLVPNPSVGTILIAVTDGAGNTARTINIPAGWPAGGTLYVQQWVVDVAGPSGFAATNAIAAKFQ